LATFYNQATLKFGGRVTNSNITEGEIVSGLTLTKTPVNTSYGVGDGIVYAITLSNADTIAKTNLTITDDLGAYSLPGGMEQLVPLTYVEGSILYYQNGVLQTSPTVQADNTLVISGIEVPAGGNVIILYEVIANEFAPVSQGSQIYNAVTVSGEGLCENLSANAEIGTRDEPNLSIAKAATPDTVTCGEQITYTFIIQNSGNTEVVATDNLLVSDLFNPVLSNITVALNGTSLVEGIGYTYDEGSGQFTTIGGAIPVPAATYTRDPITGVLASTPGVAILTVTGTI
jgi:uncharacterized repeat protein (TIGR01451 family)